MALTPCQCVEGILLGRGPVSGDLGDGGGEQVLTQQEVELHWLQHGKLATQVRPVHL